MFFFSKEIRHFSVMSVARHIDWKMSTDEIIALLHCKLPQFCGPPCHTEKQEMARITRCDKVMILSTFQEKLGNPFDVFRFWLLYKFVDTIGSIVKHIYLECTKQSHGTAHFDSYHCHTTVLLFIFKVKKSIVWHLMYTTLIVQWIC